jgi:hypothetical protein
VTFINDVTDSCLHLICFCFYCPVSELLDVIPGKRRHDTVTSDSDSESVDDEDGLEVSVFP